MKPEEAYRQQRTSKLVELAKQLDSQKYSIERELESRQDQFTVSIFGSARIESNDEIYLQVRELARRIGSWGVNIVTGGGPGIMQAANEGAKQAKPTKFNSFGLNIKLPTEQSVNPFVDRADTHQLFSSRLDQFVRLSHMFIVASGGIGTILELMYMWQLNQVQLTQPKKIVLFHYDAHWRGLIEWMQESLACKSLVSPGDLEMIQPANTIEDVLALVQQQLNEFTNKGHV